MQLKQMQNMLQRCSARPGYTYAYMLRVIKERKEGKEKSTPCHDTCLSRCFFSISNRCIRNQNDDDDDEIRYPGLAIVSL